MNLVLTKNLFLLVLLIDLLGEHSFSQYASWRLSRVTADHQGHLCEERLRSGR
jgi:hypothetical protein